MGSGLYSVKMKGKPTQIPVDGVHSDHPPGWVEDVTSQATGPSAKTLLWMVTSVFLEFKNI